MSRKLNSFLNVQDTVGLRIRDRFRRAALAVAVFAVVAVLYFSLIPALAQGGKGYLYFDNSLSQYDRIECYVGDSEMTLLRLDSLQSGDARIPSDLTNVNTANVFVTENEVTDGSDVRFVGIDSGTVYDTVTNNRVNSAAREWGYDYIDFEWDTGVFTFDSQFDCYYAPPKLLQNTYNAEASLVDIENNNAVGEKKLQRLIWAQGDTNELGQSAKPESDNSFIEPNSGKNRTFTNAVFAMNGCRGAVEAVNTYAENSQSNGGQTYEGSVALNGDGNNGLTSVEQNGGKVYHATADFYDFFSDWEIAGKSLSQHNIAYGYENAAMQRNKLFDIEIGSTKDIVGPETILTFPEDTAEDSEYTDDGNGNKVKKVGDFVHVITSDYVSDDESSLQLHTVNYTNEDASKGLYYKSRQENNEYVYLPLDNICNSGKTYELTYYLTQQPDREKTENVKQSIDLLATKDNESYTQKILNESFSLSYTPENGYTWQTVTATFTIPDGCTDLKLKFDSGNKGFVLDDISIKELIEDGVKELENPVTSIEREIRAISNSDDTIVGTNTSENANQFSDKDVYSLSGIVAAGQSGTLSIFIDYVSNPNTGAVAQRRELGTFNLEARIETEISITPFQHYPGYKEAKLVLAMNDGIEFVADLEYYKEYATLSNAASFSEGTERISYSYQGMLWNQAISDYYSSQYQDNSGIVPLYFASNSWLTGNGRYNLVDSKGNPTGFTEADVTSGNIFVKTNDSGGVYLYPFERQYLKDLFGFNRDSNNPYLTVPVMNISFGQSNSRSVTGLTELVSNGDVSELRLKNTNVNSPYFNKAFLEGDNSFKAKLGNVYEDVKFDFVFNEETGYYEYDSTRAKYATRVTQGIDSQTQQPYYYMDYYNYDEIVYGGDTSRAGVKKADNNIYDENGSSQTIYQFFPFNSPLTNSKFSTENLMFSMNLNIPFNMYADKALRNESMFKFSGDDDVWVYVDDKLALDMGGTHAAVGGLVDLKNGYAVTGSSYLDKTGLYDTSGNLVSGMASALTDVERAAFALIASARIENAGDVFEVGIDKDKSQTIITPVKYTLNGSEVYAHFFDDVYIAADGIISPTYSYTIDEANGTITVEFENIKNASGSMLEDANKNEVTSGKATFALSVFSIDNAGGGSSVNNTDLTKHELSVYYMERGLNSSNFKMEFNFIQATIREVSKEWADGIAKHDNVADFVEIELYRTEPTLIEEQVPKTELVDETEDYKLDKGIMYVKVQAQRGGGAVQSNERFYAKEEEILVFYKKYSQVQNYYLTINGITVDKEMYDRFAVGDNPLYSIYIQSTDGNETVIYPFLDENYSKYIGTDEKGTYIQVPAEYQLWVKVNDENLSYYKNVTATPTVEDAEKYSKSTSGDDETLLLSQWRLNDIQGFLIDAAIYDCVEQIVDNGDGTTSTSYITGELRNDSQASIPSSVTARKTYIDSASGLTLGEDGKKLNFVILKNKKYNKNTSPQYYTYTYDVKLVPEGDSLSMKSDVVNDGDRIRPVSQRITDWYGSLTSFGERQCPGAYGMINEVMKYLPPESASINDKAANIPPEYRQNGDLWSLSVMPENAKIIEYSCHNNFSQALKETGQQGETFRTPTINLIRKTGNQILVETGEYDTIFVDAYTDAILLQNAILNKENDWTYIFDTIVEGEPVGGVMKDYIYFIREVNVKSEYGDMSAYKQVYYDENGVELKPQQVKFGDETLTLYPNVSSVKVANIPLTDLNMAKEWGDTVDEDKKTEQIFMRVYSSTDGVNGNLVKRVAISSESEWKALIEDLPLYEATVSTNDDGTPSYTWKRLYYYAAEDPVYYWRDDGEGKLNQVQFLAAYTPLEKASLTVDGEQVNAYKFSEANLNSLSVKTQNMLNNPGVFSLRLLKMSEDESELLENAVFELYKLNGNEYVSQGTYKTDENGEINFGTIDVSENEVIGDKVTYKIVEIDSPFGFELPEDGAEIVFTVTQGAEKALDLTYTQYGELVTHSTTEDMTVVKFTVKNKYKPIIMPDTGGSGTSSIYFGGFTALIVSFAGIVMFNKSKRKNKLRK